MDILVLLETMVKEALIFIASLKTFIPMAKLPTKVLVKR